VAGVLCATSSLVMTSMPGGWHENCEQIFEQTLISSISHAMGINVSNQNRRVFLIEAQSNTSSFPLVTLASHI